MNSSVSWVYSFGLIMIEIFTQKLYFSGKNSIEIANKVKNFFFFLLINSQNEKIIESNHNIESPFASSYISRFLKVLTYPPNIRPNFDHMKATNIILICIEQIQIDSSLFDLKSSKI